MKNHYEAKLVEIKRLGFGKVRTEGTEWQAIDTVGPSHHAVSCSSKDEAEQVAAEMNREIEETARDFPHAL